MEDIDIKVTLLNCLEELGIYIENTDMDFDLREYIADSLQFITFIVSLEEALEIEIPDDLLLYDKMHSFNGYCKMIEGVLSGTYQNAIL